jgi:hypothetical protein
VSIYREFVAEGDDENAPRRIRVSESAIAPWLPSPSRSG